MTEVLLIVLVILVVSVAALQTRLLSKKASIDPGVIEQALQSVDQSYERAERAVRDEIAKNREEGTSSARAARQELSGALQTMAETLNQQLVNLTHTNDQKLERVRDIAEGWFALSEEERARRRLEFNQ